MHAGLHAAGAQQQAYQPSLSPAAGAPLQAQQQPNLAAWCGLPLSGAAASIWAPSSDST